MEMNSSREIDSLAPLITVGRRRSRHNFVAVADHQRREAAYVHQTGGLAGWRDDRVSVFTLLEAL